MKNQRLDLINSKITIDNNVLDYRLDIAASVASTNHYRKKENINNSPKELKKNNIRNLRLMTNEIC